MTSEIRNCQNCKQQFTIEPEDFNFYEKLKVPPPTWCPECRMIRRFIWRNERMLFRKPDAHTDQEILSWLHGDSSIKVYERDFWWSDGWDPLQYGQPYDFSKPFFVQFKKLLDEVPWPSRTGYNLVNSDYSSNGGNLKNCYLCFYGSNTENSAYVVGHERVREGFDMYQSRHTELCFENYMADDSYRVFFSVNVEDCHDVWFSRNLIGCQSCFGCVNLRNKSYYIFNEPHTKDSYQEFMKRFSSSSRSAMDAMRAKAEKFWLEYPQRFTLGINNVNSTGEHIEHSKNVHESFMVHEGEDMKYCQMSDTNVKDIYDGLICRLGASLVYESCGTVLGVSEMRFAYYCYPESHHVSYSVHCQSSSDLFGCVGLKKKQYCIFNKQYSKEEYESLKSKIVEHMNTMPYTDKYGRVYRYGEFFPPEFSPFAYNETIAQDFFPLSKEQAEAKGYLWREPGRREYETTLDANNLPDDIKEVQDDIVKEIIKCAKCEKAYRIIKMELGFYRRILLPLPSFCPECRFKERFKFVNPPKFWSSKCQCAGATDDRKIYKNEVKHFHGADHCPNEFRTSYAPGRPEIVYCEQCYKTEVT